MALFDISPFRCRPHAWQRGDRSVQKAARHHPAHRTIQRSIIVLPPRVYHFFNKSQNFRVKLERLVLVVNKYAIQFNLHNEKIINSIFL
jgi:hypothetical protein